MVALIAIVITGALASVAVIGGLPSTGSDQVAVETASGPIDGTGSAPVAPEPATSDTTAPVIALRLPVPEVTTPAVGETPIPPPDTGATPVPATRSSWSIEEGGVTVTANIDPATPRAGDTVTLSYTTAGADFCCWSLVIVDGAVISENRPVQGACPVPPITSGSATVALPRSGAFTIQVATRRIEDLCGGASTVHSANLFATFNVLPA